VQQSQTWFARRINGFQRHSLEAPAFWPFEFWSFEFWPLNSQTLGQFSIPRLLGIALLSLLMWLTAANAAWADGFVLCGEACRDLGAAVSSEAYFVGYGRGQHLELAGEVVDQRLGRQLQLYPHVSDFQTEETVPNIDEQHLEVAGEVAGEVADKTATSIHRFDEVKVGFVQKSEALSLSGLPPRQQRSGKVKATSELVWGDTLRISSTRLSEGSPVALQIEREIGGGFRQPATDYANYRLTSQTWVNGHLVPKLDYQLAKYSGPGEVDREQGRGKAGASVLVKVGEAVTVESRLQVQDGVVASDDPQLLDGYDSVAYHLTLLSDDSCATSDSGLLTTGDCD